ncbi:helix-turn-helix transcriptional regulator [Paenibacillus sp. FSL H7-0756]|uniref:helix-turn-helix transcriptional regulator n=1 Tax=Paenibacillus sp. FSL H7-0756 TaxID=2954738 RepID=UPI0030F755D4
MNDERRRKELADFLRSRRSRVSPVEMGLQVEQSRRRTKGLRREEVSSLSGISLPWYTALEQGRDIHVSEQVLESLVRTLRLNSGERNHLLLLANPSPLLQSNSDDAVPPSLQKILDRMGTYPAYIMDRRWNVIAMNQITDTLCRDFSRDPELGKNILWRVFAVEESKLRIANWEKVASMMVAHFRSRFALYMNDSWYQELAEKLMDRSEEFRTLWERHDVSDSFEGEQIIRLPETELLTFQYHTFKISESSDYAMRVFTPVSEENKVQVLEDMLEADRRGAGWLIQPNGG